MLLMVKRMKRSYKLILSLEAALNSSFLSFKINFYLV
jgi:hypothetical protein